MPTIDLITPHSILAMAPPNGQSAEGGLLSFLPMILIFVAFYFLLIAPQRKAEATRENGSIPGQG